MGFLTFIITVFFTGAALAQTALPPLPSPSGVAGAPPPLTFNPLNPIGQPMPMQPFQPMDTPGATTDDNPDTATLPLPQSNEDLEFFQGYQLEDLPKEERDAQDAPPEVVEIIERDEQRVQLPLDRFNYKSQMLPKTIYKKHYRPDNRHLPIARYEKDYDFAIMTAAALDDLNGVKALLDSAGRDLDVRNRFGDTLLMTAARYGAHRVTRFLLARRADPYAHNHRGETPMRIAYMRKDPITIGTYHSIDVRGFSPLGFNKTRTPSSTHRRAAPINRAGYQARGRQFTPASWHKR